MGLIETITTTHYLGFGQIYIVPRVMCDGEWMGAYE